MYVSANVGTSHFFRLHFQFQSSDNAVLTRTVRVRKTAWFWLKTPGLVSTRKAPNFSVRYLLFVTINTDENCQVTHENLKHWFGSSTTVTSASPYESQVTIIANNVSVIWDLCRTAVMVRSPGHIKTGTDQGFAKTAGMAFYLLLKAAFTVKWCHFLNSPGTS